MQVSGIDIKRNLGLKIGGNDEINDKTIIIAKNLRIIRTEKEMSQQEVADKAGISRTAYRNIESGSAEPKVNTLLNIAKALSVRLVDIVRETRKLTKIRFD